MAIVALILGGIFNFSRERTDSVLLCHGATYQVWHCCIRLKKLNENGKSIFHITVIILYVRLESDPWCVVFEKTNFQRLWTVFAQYILYMVMIGFLSPPNRKSTFCHSTWRQYFRTFHLCWKAWKREIYKKTFQLHFSVSDSFGYLS